METEPLKHPSAVHAAVVTAATLLIFIVVCAPLQASLGMTGLILTELIVLAAAIAGAFVVSRLTGEPLSGFFPLKLVPPRQLLGSILLFIGGYAAMYAVSMVMVLLVPATEQDAEALAGFISAASPRAAFFIVAFLPSVCEEALNRGLILRCLRGSAESMFGGERVIARSIMVTAAGGLIFGLFHLDPYRFLPTAILGGVLSYICYKTGSMIPGMGLHFLNNLFALTGIAAGEAGAAGETAAALTAEEQAALDALMAEADALTREPKAVVGMALIMLGWAVIFMRLGQRLMKPKIRYQLPDDPTEEDFERLRAEISAARNPVAADGSRYAPGWVKSLAIILTVMALMTIGASLVSSVPEFMDLGSAL